MAATAVQATQQPKRSRETEPEAPGQSTQPAAKRLHAASRSTSAAPGTVAVEVPSAVKPPEPRSTSSKKDKKKEDKNETKQTKEPRKTTTYTVHLTTIFKAAVHRQRTPYDDRNSEEHEKFGTFDTKGEASKACREAYDNSPYTDGSADVEGDPDSDWELHQEDAPHECGSDCESDCDEAVDEDGDESEGEELTQTCTIVSKVVQVRENSSEPERGLSKKEIQRLENMWEEPWEYGMTQKKADAQISGELRAAYAKDRK